jgi:hypothetical protein
MARPLGNEDAGAVYLVMVPGGLAVFKRQLLEAEVKHG